MTTFAALPDAQELEALTCAAWMTYADAEAAAWDRLQATLHEIEATRSEPPVSP